MKHKLRIVPLVLLAALFCGTISFTLKSKEIEGHPPKNSPTLAGQIDSLPQLVTPKDNNQFSPEAFNKPIQFRWASSFGNAPIQQDRYLLRIWRVEAGQEVEQVIQNQKPIFTQEVENKNECIIDDFANQFCNSNSCQYAWNVEKLENNLSRNAQSMVSRTFSFVGFNKIDTQFDSLQVECCQDSLMAFQFLILNNLSNAVRITSLDVDKINGNFASTSISNLSPTLPVIIPGNGSQLFTGTLPCLPNAQTIRFVYAAEDASDNAITETEVETDTLSCICDPCEAFNVSIVNDQLTTVSNSSDEVNLIYTLSGLDATEVKKMTIELVYFNIEQTGDPECAKCALNHQWGNFIPPSNTYFGFEPPVLRGDDFGRIWTWNSMEDQACEKENETNADVQINTENETDSELENFEIEKVQPFNKNNVLSISVPPGNTLECCGDKINICIRYTWWDFCCQACEEIRCYELVRNPSPNSGGTN